jgi:tRNA nucleotidyltransferase (CCA-adding enzyme)
MIRKHVLFEKKIRQDAFNTVIFGKGHNRELYLVGGYIRDAFRGIESRDRDYVLRGGILPFVRSIQNVIGGSIVVFKMKNTIRLALNNRHTFDFSQIQNKIEDDLSKRDFTINALAWSPVKGLIDLYDGISDLEKSVISCISQRNMIDDPLRMLRAYRFSAELNGTIDSTTRQIIKRHHKRILAVSNERITLEMFHLLNAQQSSNCIKMAFEDGLLIDLIFSSINELENNIKALDNFENRILHLLSKKIKVRLHDIFAQNLTYKGLLCLHILLKDSDQEKMPSRLTMSKRIISRIKAVSNGIRRLTNLRKITSHSLFEIFRNSGEAAVDICIVSNKLNLLRDLSRFRRVWKKGLLTSEEAINLSEIKTGIDVGRMLLLLKMAEFGGRLKSRREAIAYIKSVVKSKGN